MVELSIPEIAKLISTPKADVTPGAAHKRLQRAGYTPSRYIGVNAMFELSEKDIEILKQRCVRGRPKADSEVKTTPSQKPKRLSKKTD